jgi:isoleucyl-tRNA synthetase
VQTAIRAAKAGDWSQSPDGVVTAGGIALQDGEFSLDTVVSGQPGGTPESDSRSVAMLAGGGFVVLDSTVTPQLAAAGLANDVVRVVQQARRDAGLAISDRIRLTVTGDPTVWEAVVNHQDTLVRETLADAVGASSDLAALPVGDGVVEATVGDGLRVRVKVEKL